MQLRPLPPSHLHTLFFIPILTSCQTRPSENYTIHLSLFSTQMPSSSLLPSMSSDMAIHGPHIETSKLSIGDLHPRPSFQLSPYSLGRVVHHVFKPMHPQSRSSETSRLCIWPQACRMLPRRKSSLSACCVNNIPQPLKVLRSSSRRS